MKFVAALVAAASLLMAQDATDARDWVNRGVTAFKSANYPEAVQAFQKAVQTDPNFVTARLYLATAYMQQYVPGAQSPENSGFSESAFREFNKALELDPSNTTATESIASLYLKQKQWDRARQWYEKLTAMDPANAGAYYSMGFIAWSQWYPAYMEARKQFGMRPEDPGPMRDGDVKRNLKIEYTPVIERGLQALQKALAINPEYDDAMAYMNLLIRQRADLSDTKVEYEREIKVADDWLEKAFAAKKRK